MTHNFFQKLVEIRIRWKQTAKRDLEAAIFIAWTDYPWFSIVPEQINKQRMASRVV